MTEAIQHSSEHYMREAIRLARKGSGMTSPNPLVGAVVVRDGRIVGKGFHERLGGPHAEVNALRSAGRLAAGAVLYVTLEPCNHQGRTPPCTDAVLNAGISMVMVGMLDPNPKVTGGGAAELTARGIPVKVGILQEECRRLNQPFIKHSTTGVPYVTLKTAATLDGHTATRNGDSRWITNEKSRKFVHRLRFTNDAVLVGIGTALLDDPQLTVRHGHSPHQPVRVIMDSDLRLPIDSNLVKTARDVPVLVACSAGVPGEKAAELESLGVKILRFRPTQGRVPVPELLRELGRIGITSVLVEGGAHVAGSFFESGSADAFHYFYAPKILGDSSGVPMIAGPVTPTIDEAFRAFNLRVRRFGQDVMISGRLHEELY